MKPSLPLAAYFAIALTLGPVETTWAQARGRGAPVSAPKPAPAKPAPAAPRVTAISNQMIETLALAAAEKGTFLGVSQFQGDSLALMVLSHRAMIASRIAAAASSGGRYVPPQELRSDVVVIDCGDSDIGDRFDCARVSVATPDGRRISPLSYSDGPNSYRNALGGTWSVREVMATYSPNELRKGFSVTYASTDGTEWTFPVSAEAAERELLLTLQAGQPPPWIPPVPSDIRLEFRVEGDVIRVMNPTPSQWTRCVAEIPGVTSATLSTLEPNGAALLRRNEFWPAMSADTELTAVQVNCWAGTKIFTVRVGDALAP